MERKIRNYLYLKSIWSGVAGFADQFDDMSILAYDSQGRAVGYKRVPVTLGPKEKVVAALIAEEGGTSVYPPDNYLPRISIAWNGFDRDLQRQRGNHERRKLFVDIDDGCERIRSDLQPVPWKMSFEVTLWTKYMDDMAQLLENILPFYNPDAPISFIERGVGLERQAQVTLESVQTNFQTDIQNTERRYLQANLSFSMEINFYRPENPIGRPIKRVTVRTGMDSTVQTRNIDGSWNAGAVPTSDGETVNTAALPCVSGDETILDNDQRIWSVITAFDEELGTYMADRYRNIIEPLRPIVPETPPPYDPNVDNKTEDIFYEMYGTQMDIGLSGYSFDIPPVMYNKQDFVPDGQDITFTWTWSISGSSYQDGQGGTLYEGDGIDTSDVSGSYFVINDETNCSDIIDPPEECPDE